MKMKNLKKIKKFMAMFLCVLMVMNVAVPALATAVTASDSDATEPTEHIVMNLDEDVNPCGTCGNIPCECEPAEVCGTCGKEPCECELMEVCGTCGKEPCECEPEEVCESCGKEPCECAPAEVCADCGKEPCECEPEEVCATCGKASCECAPAEVCANCGKEPCECESVEVCADCGKEPCECKPAEVCADCGKETCECVVCESCGKKNCTGHEEETEEASPSDATCADCGNAPCTCEVCEICGEKKCKGHAPANVFNTAEMPKKGDKVWIKAGSVIYKEKNGESGHTLEMSCHVEIVEISYDENGKPEWYEYKYSGLGGILGNIFLREYKYVHVDHTSVENPDLTPVDPNACTCGEYAPENLADHTDSCPRKQYVKSLFEGKTAEEIYAEWDSYDEATQEDILDMVQRYDNAKYEALYKLVNGSTNEGVNIDGTEITVYGAPKNVSLTVDGVSENQYHSELGNHIDENSELLYVYDIKLTNPDGSVWQPDSGKSVTITLDFNGTGLADGNVLSILHEHNGKLKSLGNYVIEDGKLTFSTDGFSKFYFYITYTYGEKSFTMSGGSKVYLSEILRELSVSYDIGDVANVQFTNPDVLEITKVDSDWKLESLEPFGSEEILTILFNNGEIIEIVVKDPVIFNYAVDSDITNVPMLATKNKTFDKCNNGDKEPLNKTYLANSTEITNAELINAAGTAGSVDIIIYAKPGMAIGFEGGTVWGDSTNNELGFARPTFAGNEIWYWSWIYDSTIDAATEHQNYIFVKEGTAGQQATFKIQAVSGNTKVTVNVTLCSVAESSPILLEENLPAGYSLKNVPVTLYNYDGLEFNQYYERADSSKDFFAFSGYSMGENSRTEITPGWESPSGEAANAGGSVAMMGIVKEKLVNGLPVVSQGQNVDLFSTNAVNGKTVYDDVQFQFVYNESTGYYTYNSALNHAQYNSSTNTIQLYKQSLAPADTANGDSHGNAGFYPFEDINKAYTNTAFTAISEEEWKDKIETSFFELTPAQYAADIVATSATNPASTVDMHYGIQINSDFYMPKGKQLNGQDMIYKFTGDDDLWVFIDGKLVLDIGGGHTHVSGSFNLTSGEVWVEKYTKLDTASGGSYATETKGTNLSYTDSFISELKDDQMHTIQVFYLERHSGVSNCYMHFNLPLVPSDAVNVSKNLVNHEGKELSVTPDVEYTFTLYTASDIDDNCDATDFKAYANEEYTVTGVGAPSETQSTDANGQFKLKDGWIASFQGIPRFTNVYVVESEPGDIYTYPKSTVSVNKAAEAEYTFESKTDTKVMQLNSSINFDFVNYMQTQPLKIEKQVVNGSEGLVDSKQKFDFTLDFTKNILETGEGEIFATNKSSEVVALTDAGTFQLGHDESITIPRVPVNMTFTLMESNPDTENGSFDAPQFDYPTCKLVQESGQTVEPNAFDTEYEWIMTDSAENKITVINQQRFDLIISKSGIVDTDHHPASGENILDGERQSTIYTVVGTIGEGDEKREIVKMPVAICGNKSVTIKRLPVGTYTVTEDENWSWRYTSDGGATKTVSNSETDAIKISDSAVANVGFENRRDKQYWLSGDCWSSNWWGENAGTTVGRREYDFSSISNNS